MKMVPPLALAKAAISDASDSALLTLTLNWRELSSPEAIWERGDGYAILGFSICNSNSSALGLFRRESQTGQEHGSHELNIPWARIQAMLFEGDFGVFSELKDPKYFCQVRVLDGTVFWPNEQDICPDTLYMDSSKVA